LERLGGSSLETNVYAYVDNDPIDRSDPAGTESPTVIFNNSFGEQSDPETAGREAAAGRAFLVIPGVSSLEEGYEGHYFAAAALGAVDLLPLGSGASALKRNLIEAGTRFAKGEEAHHVVAERVAAFQGARDILEPPKR
jgi:hypothetical protein